MARLFVFNPENDLALACGEPNFTPPAMARRIRRDLQLIQIWLGDEGLVYAPHDEAGIRFLNSVKMLFPESLKADIYDGSCGIESISPWGWSPAIASELGRLFPDAVLEKSAIQKIRELSHRRITVAIANYLKNNYSGIGEFESPVLCCSLQEVLATIEWFGVCMVKAPWSGSGKGVFRVDKENYRVYENWIRSIISKQGSVVCEKYLDKVQDFALEFYSDGCSIRYVGPSVFFNNSRFSYEKAMVASTSLLENHLQKYIKEDCLSLLKSAVAEALGKLVAQSYVGYMGVDMLVYREAGNLCVMPCVELNLRMTMGLIANRIGEKFLEKGRIGEMSVLWHRDAESLTKYVDSVKKPVIRNGRLESGTLFLAPIYPDSSYTASVTIT